MKPCIVEFTYPLGLGKFISSVTRHQRRAVNPVSEHCVNHRVIIIALAIAIVMYSHCVCITICASQPPAVAVATCPLSTRNSEDQLRYGIPVDRPGRDIYASTLLGSIGCVIRCGSAPDDYYTARLKSTRIGLFHEKLQT